MGYVKKFIFMVLSAVMVLAATAYGKEEKGKEETANSDALIGKWICYFFGKDGVATIALQFNKDSSGVGSLSGEESDTTFSWTLEGTGITLAHNWTLDHAAFDGETIVVYIGGRKIGPFIKEGDKGLDEEASRKNLIGSWTGIYSDERKGETLFLYLLFNKDGEGSAFVDISYDHVGSTGFRMISFTWSLTGVKLMLKFSKSDSSLTSYYNGKKVLNFGPMILTKE